MKHRHKADSPHINWAQHMYAGSRTGTRLVETAELRPASTRQAPDGAVERRLTVQRHIASTGDLPNHLLSALGAQGAKLSSYDPFPWEDGAQEYLPVGSRSVPVEVLHRRWGSLGSFLRGLPSEPVWPSSQSHFEHPKKFNEVPLFRDMLRLARHGWREGAARIHKLHRAYAKHITGLEEDFVVREGLTGGQVNMGRLLAGHPRHFVSTPLDQTQKRVLRLTVDTNIACTGCPFRSCTMMPIPAQATFLRGAAVAMVAEALERLEHKVEVVFQTATQYQRVTVGPPIGFTVQEVVLKRAGERLDPARLALTAHAGLVSQLEFAASEALMRRAGYEDRDYYNMSPPEGHAASGRWAYGSRYLGHIMPVPLTLRGDIHVDNLHRAQWDSQEQAIEWVLESLRGQGVEVAGA